MTEKINKLSCYKCGSVKQLLIQEKREKESHKVVEKKFICVECAEILKNEAKA